MHRLKSRGIVVLAVLGLFAFSGIAMADTEDDTVFNYGYDEENQFLIWNVTSLEYEPDQEALEEALADPYDALVEACSLALEEGSYDYTFDSETGEIVLTLEGDAVELPQECDGLSGAYVTGPEGQVNHGMFLKLLNEQYDATGNRGCLIRHIAQSDLGMDDQKVEAVEGFEPDEDQNIDDGKVSFTTAQTNCINGNPFAGAEEEGAEGENGAPTWVSELKGGENGPANPAAAGEGRP